MNQARTADGGHIPGQSGQTLSLAWPFQRGYAAIGLHHPKNAANVGGTLRAAYAYGAQMVAIAGARNNSVRHGTNTPQAWKHLPTFVTDDLRHQIPYDCIPVAVDLVPDAVPLPSYQHPARAFYIFGPEDGTLGNSVLEWCPQRIMVPTRMCMNLAATVNVVLYDRISKAMRAARKQPAHSVREPSDSTKERALLLSKSPAEGGEM